MNWRPAINPRVVLTFVLSSTSALPGEGGELRSPAPLPIFLIFPQSQPDHN
jgi:hypothetical protein